MPLVVLPALIPDIKSVYDVYFSAFEHENMGSIMLKILFPHGHTSPEFRKAHAEGTLAYWHHTDVQYTFKCVDTDTGEIIGMALGDVYIKERSEEERKNHGVPWLEGEERERAEKVLNPLWEVREKFFGGRPYIYCHVIGVSPAHQGRKAGALLIQWGLEVGEKAGLPVYFESSPSTVKLYERMGFETLPEKIVHKAETLGTPKDVEVPLMVKMPGLAGGMTFAEWMGKGYPKFEGRQRIEGPPKEKKSAGQKVVVEVEKPQQAEVTTAQFADAGSETKVAEPVAVEKKKSKANLRERRLCYIETHIPFSSFLQVFDSEEAERTSTFIGGGAVSRGASQTLL
ncbi:hypothetical protein MKZ38_003067 [Zalerion maritima]|uniref:N-acetyltransferase domain-containing protein n=1 Tax=Zalerion maritima TaxID=339359 RepID=A0AAD5RUP6_9PEZI|nr:hypothetical protein MKZ38_003067 [Zalerion maritima]